MGKSLFKELGGNVPQNQQNQNDMGRSFDNFARNFQGDPNAELQRLRSSGQMPPQVFDTLYSMATSIVSRFRKK
jgi:parvulin-like peptidyl-prolyl isomerase